MNFTNNIFLFIFLPITLLTYHLMPGNRTKNAILLLASVIFYAAAEPIFIFTILLSVILNYLAGRIIYYAKNKKTADYALIGSLIFNFGILFVYKYLDFIINAINNLPLIAIPTTGIALPIGISFYTFQIASYIIDVYRYPKNPLYYQENPFKLAEYILMFPQLVAGPIVRYEQIARQIDDRNHTLNKLYSGATRFIYGLAKKMLIANSLATVADRAFTIPSEDAGAGFLWLGAISYGLQIFYDFSGYSDMAIGMGKMFGFNFPKNFDSPYTASSITKFWKKWHITLSAWFKDYVYIPLGGSRLGLKRQIINLLITWALTGLWHGANWTFVAWGLGYFALLAAEKIILNYFGKPVDQLLPKPLAHIMTLVFVIILWIPFRAPNLRYCLSYLGHMLNLAGKGQTPGAVSFYVESYLPQYIAAITCATDVPKNISYILKSKVNPQIYNIIRTVLCLILLNLCITVIAKSGYNPFIYYNF